MPCRTQYARTLDSASACCSVLSKRVHATQENVRDMAEALALAEQRLGGAAAELERRGNAMAQLRMEREGADAQACSNRRCGLTHLHAYLHACTPCPTSVFQLRGQCYCQA